MNIKNEVFNSIIGLIVIWSVFRIGAWLLTSTIIKFAVTVFIGALIVYLSNKIGKTIRSVVVAKFKQLFAQNIIDNKLDKDRVFETISEITRR